MLDARLTDFLRPLALSALVLGAGVAGCDGAGSGSFISPPVDADPAFVFDLARRTSLAEGLILDALQLDLDGDGAIDRVQAAAQTNSIGVAFASAPDSVVDVALGVLPVRLVSGDFDGDGALELVVLGVRESLEPDGVDRGSVAWFEWDGAAGLTKIVETELPSAVAFGVAARVVADDRDELVLAQLYERRVVVLRLIDGAPLEIASVDLLDFIEPDGDVGATVDVAVCDMDLDGLLDVCVAESEYGPAGSGRVRLLRQSVPGVLDPPTLLVDGLMLPLVRRVDDLDADGHDDLAVIDAGANGTGMALFLADVAKPAGPFWFPTPGAAVDVLSIDADGSGPPDIALALPGFEAAALLRGAFSPGKSLAFGPPSLHLLGPGPRRIAPSAFQGTDLASAFGAGELVLRGQPSHTFSVPEGYLDSSSTAVQPSSPERLAVGDIDLDGRSDVAVMLRDGARVAYMRGLPGATLSPVGSIEFNPAAPDAIGDLELADVNADGRLDTIVTLFSSGKLCGVLGNGALPPSGELQSVAVGDGPLGVGLGDFDADGDLDAVVGLYLGAAVRVLNNPGDGAFEEWIEFGLPHRPTDAAALDLDLDGIAEIALGAETSVGGALIVLRRTAEGATVPLEWTYASEFVSAPERIVVADWTGDKRPDFVVDQPRSESIYISAFIAGSDPTDLKRVDIPVGSGPGPAFALDVDADGLLDLGSATTDGDLRLFRGDGLGGFKELLEGDLEGRQLVSSITDTAFVDLDQDGRGELLFVSPDTPPVWVARTTPLDDPTSDQP